MLKVTNKQMLPTFSNLKNNYFLWKPQCHWTLTDEGFEQLMILLQGPLSSFKRCTSSIIKSFASIDSDMSLLLWVMTSISRALSQSSYWKIDKQQVVIYTLPHEQTIPQMQIHLYASNHPWSAVQSAIKHLPHQP